MRGATATDEEPIPLLQLGVASPPPSPSPMAVDDLFNSDQSDKRTGNTWTASAHIITGVIGSGVLSLAWSMAQLGWIWGPLLMLLFAAVTLFSSFLISNCYRSPDPDYGPSRNTSYIAAVQSNLGG
ncbi:amino acid permease 3-like [Salvia splendens]|uniref:amino acid permease 3-like n=1 Tax=Salvia splendens TaxID=180675 RepID=UPI001C2544CF|nr:amino acid permease 3-like [Salvia splendens]